MRRPCILAQVRCEVSQPRVPISSAYFVLSMMKYTCSASVGSHVSRALNTEATSLTTADWLNADWITAPSSANASQRARHDAAVSLLREYHATGRPFALFLRTFDIHQWYG